jgi:hypothetical protein
LGINGGKIAGCDQKHELRSGTSDFKIRDLRGQGCAHLDYETAKNEDEDENEDEGMQEFDKGRDKGFGRGSWGLSSTMTAGI